MKVQMSIRNEKQTSFVAKTIAQFNNRGFASAEKIKIVLNDLKEEGIKSLKQLNQDIINNYVKDISERVNDGDITGKTGATYVSALNTIIDYVNHFQDKNINNVSASENGIHKETIYQNRSTSLEQHNSFLNYLQDQFEQTGDDRFQRLELATELQREFGLRFRESIGLNAETIQQGLGTGKLELGRDDWTKNAREREIPITSEQQRELLNRVSEYFEQKGIVNLAGHQDISEIRNHQQIQEMRNFAYSIAQEQGFNFHGERHSYAQERFSQLWEEKTGVALESPIQYYSERLDEKPWWEYAQEETGLSMPELKELNFEIRQEITEELGHSRIDITNTYLGHP